MEGTHRLKNTIDPYSDTMEVTHEPKEFDRNQLTREVCVESSTGKIGFVTFYETKCKQIGNENIMH